MTSIHKKHFCTNEIPSSILNELKSSNIPQIIISSYENLINLLKEDEIYGALIKTKDTFELIIKLPLIIMLSHISNKVYQKDNSNSDFVNEFSSLHTLLQEFIHDAVSYQLTLGNWVTIAGEIKQRKVVNLFNDTNAPAILETLHCINQINHNAFTSNKHGEPVAAWRNKTIGHGALNCNKEEVKKDILNKLQLLNELLNETKNAYAKIIIDFDNNCILVKSTQDSTRIVVDPFISLLNDELKKSDKCKKLLFNDISVFDSYNDKKQIGHIINTITGKKNPSKDLSKTLSFIDNNLKKASSLALINTKNMGYLVKDTIYTDEIELLNSLQNSTFYQGSYFSDWFINCIDNYSGGVFLCCAERGMGKSAFTRAIDQNENTKIENNAKLKKYLNNNSQLLIRTFHFNSYYNSDAKTFIKKLKDIFTTNLHTNKNKSSYLQTITYISHSIEERYVALHTALSNDTISSTERKTLFLDFLKSLHSVWKYKYYKEKLILVLDGIDEIKSGTTNIHIADWIPTPEEIKTNNLENIYIIITCRCKEEIASNHTLLQFLESDIFVDTLVIKRESKETKYKSAYSQTIITNIQNTLTTKIDDKQKKYPKDKAVKLAETLEWRFNYLTAYKKIYLTCTEEELQNFTTDPFGTYINHLNKLSKSYSQDIQLLLNLLAMTDEALTINEISYLLTGDNRPTFRTYGMLMDIANFLTIERDYRRGTLFNLSHPEWIEKIRANNALIKNKVLLDDILVSKFNDLLKSLTKNKDLSSPYFDGESWLLANVKDINIDLHDTTFSFFKLEFGKNIYQLNRTTKLYKHLINTTQNQNTFRLSNTKFQDYIYSHLILAECCYLHSAIDDAKKYYESALSICLKTKKSDSFSPYLIESILATIYNYYALFLNKISPPKSLEYYEKTIAIRKRLINSPYVINRSSEQYELSISYINYSLALKQIDINKALVYCKKAIEIREKLSEDCNNGGKYFYSNALATAYNNLAGLLTRLEPNEAKSNYEKAIAIREDLANDFNNAGRFFDYKYLLITYNNMASLLKYTYPSQSREYYRRAITIGEKLSKDYENGGLFFNINFLAIAYINLANLLEPTTSSEALAYYKKAIVMQEKLTKDYENGGLFYDINNLAFSYTYLAKILTITTPNEAEKYYLKAITIRETLDIDANNGGLFFDRNGLAEAYINYALFLQHNNINKALHYCKKAILIRLQLLRQYNNGGHYFYSNYLATAYNHLGNLLKNDAPEKSLKYYKKAICIQEHLAKNTTKLNDIFDTNTLATSYNNLALILAKSDTKNAIEYFKKAIVIRTKLYEDYLNGGKFFDANFLAISYSNIADLLKTITHFEVQDYYKKAVSINEKLATSFDNGGRFFDKNKLASTYIKLAMCMEDTNTNPNDIINYYEKAINIRKKLYEDYVNGGRFFDTSYLTSAYSRKNKFISKLSLCSNDFATHFER